jgi:putative lipoic acid-binding regulatory protein
MLTGLASAANSYQHTAYQPQQLRFAGAKWLKRSSDRRSMKGSTKGNTDMGLSDYDTLTVRNVEVPNKPWTDANGWHRQLDAHLHSDHEGWDNFKRAHIVVDGTMLMPETVYNIIVSRGDLGDITTFIEFGNEFGEHVRIKLPGKVTEKIPQLVQKLQKENRQRKAIEAARNGKSSMSNSVGVSADITAASEEEIIEANQKLYGS